MSLLATAIIAFVVGCVAGFLVGCFCGYHDGAAIRPEPRDGMPDDYVRY